MNRKTFFRLWYNSIISSIQNIFTLIYKDLIYLKFLTFIWPVESKKICVSTIILLLPHPLSRKWKIKQNNNFWRAFGILYTFFKSNETFTVYLLPNQLHIIRWYLVSKCISNNELYKFKSNARFYYDISLLYNFDILS